MKFAKHAFTVIMEHKLLFFRRPSSIHIQFFEEAKTKRVEGKQQPWSEVNGSALSKFRGDEYKFNKRRAIGFCTHHSLALTGVQRCHLNLHTA